MFCINCGSKLTDGAKFCANCGARVTQTTGQPVPPAPQPAPAVGGAALPAGMTRAPDGKLWWSFMDGKDECLCCLDDKELVFMREAEPQKKRSVLGTLAMEALDMAAIWSDDYPLGELPSEMRGDPAPRVTMNGKEYYRVQMGFFYITAVKDDRKRGGLKVCGSSGWFSLGLTEGQYGFVLDYLLTHCPNIKRK